jgi:hypothetical protein
MDEKLYLRLKAQLDLKHQAADFEFQTKLNSLNDVWGMANKDSPPPMSINNHADAVNCVRGVWREAAYRVVGEMSSDKQFTVKQVQAAIAERNPGLKTDAVSILIYLKKLVSDGEIEVFRQGRGRNPTVFKKKLAVSVA